MIAYFRRTPIEREYLCSVETNVLDFAHATTVVERETDRERQREREREREKETKSERKKPIWKCCTSLRTHQWKRKRYFSWKENPSDMRFARLLIQLKKAETTSFQLYHPIHPINAWKQTYTQSHAISIVVRETNARSLPSFGFTHGNFARWLQAWANWISCQDHRCSSGVGREQTVEIEDTSRGIVRT